MTLPTTYPLYILGTPLVFNTFPLEQNSLYHEFLEIVPKIFHVLLHCLVVSWKFGTRFLWDWDLNWVQPKKKKEIKKKKRKEIWIGIEIGPLKFPTLDSKRSWFSLTWKFVIQTIGKTKQSHSLLRHVDFFSYI